LGLSADVTLLPNDDTDALEASATVFGGPSTHDKKRQEKRRAIMSQSIFAPEVLTANQEPRSSVPAAEGGNRPAKRARLDPIPEDASVSKGAPTHAGQWQMDSDLEASGGGSGIASNAWKRDQLMWKSQKEARKDLSLPPVAGNGKKRKRSVMDMAKDALRRR